MTAPTYLDRLMQDAADKVSSASGDHGINAFDANACILLDCIERQQRVIGELTRMVAELQEQAALADTAKTDGLYRTLAQALAPYLAYGESKGDAALAVMDAVSGEEVQA